MTSLPESTGVESAQRGLRVDIWLWAARFFKTRSLAKQAVEAGRVEVGDSRVKPARALHVDDRVRVVRGEELLDIVVLTLDARRGPASAAALMYRETETSRLAREVKREQRRLAGFTPGGRPDKQARRDLRALKQRGGEGDDPT